MARSVAIAGHKIGGKKDPNGELFFDDEAKAKVKFFKDSLGDGVRFVLEIREDQSHLIKSHRSYYHAVVVKHVAICLRDVAGYPIDPDLKAHLDMVHEMLRDDERLLNNKVEIENTFGEFITMPNSTTRLDDDGWKDYLSNIIIFAAEVWGYVIPAKLPRYYFPTDEPKFQNYREIHNRMNPKNLI